jgi:phosphoribosylanthranilate isomerase
MGDGGPHQIRVAQGDLMSVAVKICGLSTIEALDAAVQGGASYVGLVFFPASPRNVSLDTAAAFADHVRGRAQIVALVVNPDDAQLCAIVDRVRPDWLQLHGQEPPARLAAIKARFGLPIIKALPVETASDAAAAGTYVDIADMILFDAKAPKGAALPGGNGEPFDWRVLEGIKDRIPFMLSGGLTPQNVRAALAATGASAVDVSSGVEVAPGVKDVALIQRFLHAVNPTIQVR